MRTGRPPFQATNLLHLHRLIKREPYCLDLTPACFSREERDFLRRLLVRNPRDRIDMDVFLPLCEALFATFQDGRNTTTPLRGVMQEPEISGSSTLLTQSASSAMPLQSIDGRVMEGSSNAASSSKDTHLAHSRQLSDHCSAVPGHSFTDGLCPLPIWTKIMCLSPLRQVSRGQAAHGHATTGSWCPGLSTPSHPQ